MIPAGILPLVRRAILDLLNDVGGEHNDFYLTRMLVVLGHPIARRDVVEQLRWLANEAKLIKAEVLGPDDLLVSRIIADGRDVAEGRLVVEGVSRFKTGD